LRETVRDAAVPGSGRVVVCVAAVLATVCLASCGGGGSSSDAVAARVGAGTIDGATVNHWAAVLQGGRSASETPPGHVQALRRQALTLLISRQWLIGQAASQGYTPSNGEVSQQITHIEQGSFPGGVAELREFLKSTGQSIADLELQAKAELATAHLRANAIATAPAITSAQIADYYAEHRTSFLERERREARYENRKHRAEAVRIKHEVEHGKSLTSMAEREAHEVFATAHVPPGEPYEEAIDSVKPHVVSGPFHIGADYWIYEVVKITPAYQHTLAQVSGLIRKKLESKREQGALASLAQSLTSTWAAKTDCSAGLVVWQCRQYHGSRAAESPLAAQ
jgi:parvulin-like peptidyl-prolyl isomerase